MTAAYRTVVTDSVVRDTTSGAFIPADSRNKDYVVYQAWVALGNTADVADDAMEYTP